jgi:single-stranded-DNA-specific exonuclease
MANRRYSPINKLDYGDHGLESACASILRAIEAEKRIALYADYDVDGTMSCVSWIWFFKAIGYSNFIHYIPCRMSEGYGLNMAAIRHLIDKERADVVITMDTGITANEEAAYCKQRGVEFICTDHHKIQADKMPDCIIVNPKLHPDQSYQELCGCGVTFVLLRKLGQHFAIPGNVWLDILALTGIATICDVVPLNAVNHRLAQMGVSSLLKSQRPVFVQLREACAVNKSLDEKDVGFRIGPRINAVGRLEHADAIIRAFTDEDSESLIHYMDVCNEQRKTIQERITMEAHAAALAYQDAPILFLGGDWHQGVVGIAASKVVERYWKPTWLFRRAGACKGSARSIPGFDVTEAMSFAKEHFQKFGGHRAAGGYSFDPSQENAIRQLLTEYALMKKEENPAIWQSRIDYDCILPDHLTNLGLVDHLDGLKPFGHGFEEPKFVIQGEIDRIQFYNDKTTGKPRHTSVFLKKNRQGASRKIMFFNEVHEGLRKDQNCRFLVSVSKNFFMGSMNLNLTGHDWDAGSVNSDF